MLQNLSDEEIVQQFNGDGISTDFSFDEVANFRTSILEWYQAVKRPLPWRTDSPNPDPYGIWISEIMCQQTRVETVADYWIKWMKRFPDVCNF